MTHSPGDTPRPGRPSLLLAVIGLWLMVFGTPLEAAERPLPDTIQPGVTYLQQVVDNAGATTIDHRKLAPLVDFILQDKAAGELYFSTSDRLLDPLVYHEFDLQQSLATPFAERPAVIRSSAPQEDSAGASFAGIHESYVNVRGHAAILDHIRRVWASLWSDAALLYRRELDLEQTLIVFLADHGDQFDAGKKTCRRREVGR